MKLLFDIVSKVMHYNLSRLTKTGKFSGGFTQTENNTVVNHMSNIKKVYNNTCTLYVHVPLYIVCVLLMITRLVGQVVHNTADPAKCDTHYLCNI